jgi:hypothetical protein
MCRRRRRRRIDTPPSRASVAPTVAPGLSRITCCATPVNCGALAIIWHAPPGPHHEYAPCLAPASLPLLLQRPDTRTTRRSTQLGRRATLVIARNIPIMGSDHTIVTGTILRRSALADSPAVRGMSGWLPLPRSAPLECNTLVRSPPHTPGFRAVSRAQGWARLRPIPLRRGTPARTEIAEFFRQVRKEDSARAGGCHQFLTQLQATPRSGPAVS